LESDREKIIIIAHNDIRKRADFIFSPLEISHKFMPVLLETDKYGFLNTVCYLLKNRTEYNKTVFLGGDFKNFILIILLTALKKQKIIRLGGTETIRSFIKPKLNLFFFHKFIKYGKCIYYGEQKYIKGSKKI
jgi:hypothetical protein